MQNKVKVIVKKHLEQGNILNIPLTVTPKEGVLRYIRYSLKENNKLLVVTPNPEQIMRAQEDKLYAQILHNAQISLPDGVGLLAGSAFMQKKLPENKFVRVIAGLFYGLYLGLGVLFWKDKIKSAFKITKGRDFVVDLVALANKLSLKVYLLGARSGAAQTAIANLAKNYKSVAFKASDAPELDENGKPKTKQDEFFEKQVIKDINKFKPNFLIVGIAPPKQEKWLYHNWNGLDFQCAMVCGATIDYIAGNLPYPPQILSIMGLEWLWRLVTSFKTGKSLKRIFSAFPRFPLMIFKVKILGDN